jgi:uncharacterized protein YdaU (DUF1376 family)
MPAKWQQWMPFHIDAFKSSPYVQAMRSAARSGYLYLLTTAWQTDDCTLPTDEFDLAILSGLGSEWDEHSKIILRCFTEENGRLVNKRLREEWLEAERIFNSRRKGADATNAARSGNTQGPSSAETANAQESNTGQSPDAQRTVSERSAHGDRDTVTETVTETKKVSDANASSPGPETAGNAQDPEALIYGEYPRMVARGPALKAIEKAVDRLRKGEAGMPPMEMREARVFLYKRTQVYARSPQGQRKGEDKSLIPHPATWFNASCYLDDDKEWQYVGASTPKGGITNAASQPSPARERVTNNLNALGEALAKRGLEEFRPGAGTSDEAMAQSRPNLLSGGISGGLREVGAEVFDFGSGGGVGSVAHQPRPEILSPAR